MSLKALKAVKAMDKLNKTDGTELTHSRLHMKTGIHARYALYQRLLLTSLPDIEIFPGVVDARASEPASETNRVRTPHRLDMPAY